jgi:cell filamentation protein
LLISTVLKPPAKGYIFETIYPFAGDLRTVEMSKGGGSEAWVWRLEFLSGISDFDKLVLDITSKEYDDIDVITYDLSKLLSEFLFIHPFREGNGRLSRLVCDIILAKNGFPMIGLNLKNGDNYIQKVHQGYDCNYEPMKELLKLKIMEIMNE